MNKIILRELIKCTNEQKIAVRDIRNNDNVRKFMYTEHMITLDEHLDWIERLKTDKRQIIFVALINDIASGVVSLNAIDRLHKKSEWAFYLDDNSRGGLGAALEYTFLNFAFDKLRLEKLNCEVIETNKTVIKLHKKFSFNEEGLRRKNIEKNGKRIGVQLLGLTKEDWENNKDDILEKYKKVFSQFSISVEYDGQ